MDERMPNLTAAECREGNPPEAGHPVFDGRTQADVANFLGVHPVTVAK